MQPSANALAVSPATHVVNGALLLFFLVSIFLVYWVGMAVIIRVDAKQQREKVRAAGGVDFMDRNPLPYMLLGAFCGPLPLIFYFGTTRKHVTGWLAGLAIGLGWTGFVTLVYNVVLPHLL